MVVAVNDVPTVNVTNGEAIAALKKSTSVMKLVCPSPFHLLFYCLDYHKHRYKEY